MEFSLGLTHRSSEFGQPFRTKENEEGYEDDYEFLSAECHVLTEPR